MLAGTICQHFLTLEGAILSLAQAIATVKSDVPLVTDAFYKDVVAEGMKLKAVPAPLLNLRNWILRCARCGYDVPAIADPTVQNPRQDFLRAFERDGILHTYFKWLVKYMRQGFNSMMWLDALVCWVAILQLDASKQDANDPFDLPMDPIPDAQIKPGYRNARHAWTWLVRTLGIKPEDVPLYFMPLYSTRGWSAFTPLTKATPFDVSGAGPGIDSSHVQFITASNDPHMDMLDDFRVLGESPYRLLYRVRSSYANSYEDSVFPSVNLGEACAIPNKHFSWPLPLEVDPATAHKCVRMGDQVYGLIPEAEVIPTEQIFRPDVKAVKGGIAQPIWKVRREHVERRGELRGEHGASRGRAVLLSVSVPAVCGLPSDSQSRGSIPSKLHHGPAERRRCMLTQTHNNRRRRTEPPSSPLALHSEPRPVPLAHLFIRFANTHTHNHAQTTHRALDWP